MGLLSFMHLTCSISNSNKSIDARLLELHVELFNNTQFQPKTRSCLDSTVFSVKSDTLIVSRKGLSVVPIFMAIWSFFFFLTFNNVSDTESF